MACVLSCAGTVFVVKFLVFFSRSAVSEFNRTENVYLVNAGKIPHGKTIVAMYRIGICSIYCERRIYTLLNCEWH